MSWRASCGIFFIVCGMVAALIAVGLLSQKLVLLGIISGSESDKLLLAQAIKHVVQILCGALGLLLLGISLVAPHKGERGV
jgi:hypothetical protein